MAERDGIFSGDDPFEIVRRWLDEAAETEPNDPTAMALSTVDADGMPNARVVLLKEVESNAFVFYTNYGSVKADEMDKSGKAAFVIHWKSLRRQVRARGIVTRVGGAQADAYFNSRALQSRHGAWASQQSQPLESRDVLMAKVAEVAAREGDSPSRPPFWGGFRIVPTEIEFWADGAFRLHDRFRWQRSSGQSAWQIVRLYP